MQEGEGREAAGGLGLGPSWALPPEVVYPEGTPGCGVPANREDALETQILPGPTAAVFPLRCQPLPFCIFLKMRAARAALCLISIKRTSFGGSFFQFPYPWAGDTPSTHPQLLFFTGHPLSGNKILQFGTSS